MENASKALLLAGGLLISLIIISMLVLVINSLTSYQSENNGLSEADILAAFNSEYESYNRDDVRGNELYTLASKVIDYNRRKTASIAESTDIGDTIGYKPIKLTIDFKNKQNLIKLAATDNVNRLFKKNQYVASEGNNNELETLFDKIRTMEGIYPTESLNRLATKMTKIFIDISTYTTTEQQREAKIKAIDNFNTCYGSKIFDISDNKDNTINKYWNIIKIDNTKKNFEIKVKDASGIVQTNSRNVKEDVYTYYEYMQFKRGMFKCTKINKYSDTGRIKDLTFEFTGNFK